MYVPAREASPGIGLPTVVWIGGGAVGGGGEELEGYLRLIADAGFTVVAVGYSHSPEAHDPVALRQVAAALGHLHANTERLQVDPRRIVLAGDSAGAHLAAQLATLVTSDAYAASVGITPTMWADELRGVVLCSASATDVVSAVTAEFPPAFVTAGNADPLAPQSVALVERLGQLDVDVDALLYPADHQPALAHGYQFDLDLADARLALARITAFIGRCTTA